MQADQLHQFFAYDRLTGALTWRVNRGSSARAGDRAGWRSTSGHMQVQFAGKKWLCHRLAWMLVHGEIPGGSEIDHVNGVKDDNRLENLRLVTRAGNMQNMRGASSRSATGVLGVSRRGSTWVARISADGKSHYLGTFDHRGDAHAAYIAAKRRLHDTCTI